MGLIKTGIQLAGAYGLLKVSSKAANDFQEKKQQTQARQCQCHHHHPDHHPQQYQQSHYAYDHRMNYNPGSVSYRHYPHYAPYNSTPYPSHQTMPTAQYEGSMPPTAHHPQTQSQPAELP
ncbi:uncharacterized protein BO66DRAFT_467319 [Aspergillus aculeatinus CBS 121060]|uniref:Uncharacterized protein n=1 Tax=Aspergillus aculeatinus CBS 121060 TaxID=1448322 RepID=A0ACD1HPU8_9EURO|nr:hypothetical protein BO66DRAFT_467319 [Aspergillus aculeatinus CBS 121060]RAH75650.1 hypothetical protein BO66DRAFT_467319 [Aspergillus aculeatinus CBS 121060]